MRSGIAPGGTFPTTSCRTHADHPKTQRAPGDDPLILTLARGITARRSTATSATRRVLSADRRRLHADRHDLDRRPPHEPGVPRVGRAEWPFLSDPARTVQQDLDIQEYTDPEHDHDPAHARAQAGARHPPHLQRLLVLGPPVHR